VTTKAVIVARKKNACSACLRDERYRATGRYPYTASSICQKDQARIYRSTTSTAQRAQSGAPQLECGEYSHLTPPGSSCYRQLSLYLDLGRGHVDRRWWMPVALATRATVRRGKNRH